MPKVTQQAEPPSLDPWVQCFFHHPNCSNSPTNISHTLPLDCQDTALRPELGLRGLGEALFPSPSFPVASKSGPAAQPRLQQQQ